MKQLDDLVRAARIAEQLLELSAVLDRGAVGVQYVVQQDQVVFVVQLGPEVEQ